MPKVSPQHRLRVRDQILDAAVVCFTERGFRATTMSEIIAASGLSAGAIYSYFPAKQDLTLAAVERAVAGRATDIEAAGDGDPVSPAQLLRALSDGFARAHIPLALIVQLWGEAASDADFRAVASEVFDNIGDALRAKLAQWAEAAKDLDTAEAVQWAARTVPVIVALGQGLILQQQILDRFDREAFLARVDELFT